MTEHFWDKLESEFGFEIPSYIKIGIDFSGFGNVMAFKVITNDHIATIEKCIREGLYNFLVKSTVDAMNEHDQSIMIDDNDVLISKDQLIKHFGKLHASDPTNFHFQPGDIVLIQEMVNYVKKIAESEHKTEGLKAFKCNQRKKSSKRSAKNNRSEANLEKLKQELVQRVIDCLQTRQADCILGIDLDTVVHENTVDVHINKGFGVFGSVRCVICDFEKKKKNSSKRVFYNSDTEWPCWVLSNFTKHLKTVHGLVRIESKTQQSQQKAATNDETFIVVSENEAKTELEESVVLNDNDLQNMSVESVVFVKEEIIDCKTEQPENEQIVNNTDFYTQISYQITEMMTATLSNHDSRKQMEFVLNNTNQTLTIAKINSDGNCLFSSVAHQLYGNKINSDCHRNATKELRARVVKYILDPQNFSRYVFVLQDYIYDQKKKEEITDMNTDCKLWVKLRLSQNGKWGGAETIKAVSEMEKVNVIIFNEHGNCYTTGDANVSHDRSICIAYRLAYNGEGSVMTDKRNHYDSVCDMNSSVVYAVAQTIENRKMQAKSLMT